MPEQALKPNGNLQSEYEGKSGKPDDPKNFVTAAPFRA